MDGSPATAWVASEPRATLTVNLAAPVELGTMKVLRGSGDSFGYSVEASLDGVKWTTVHTVPDTSSATDEFSLPPVQAKFVRLVFDGVGSANAPSVAELSVFSKRP